MFATHILPLQAAAAGRRSTGLLADGRSSALFAVLAGVGVALSTGGPRRPADGRAHLAAAAGLLVRGLLVGLLGLWLVGFDSPVAVILAYYGLLFVVAAPLLRLPAAALARWRRCSCALAPVLSQLLRAGLPAGPGDAAGPGRAGRARRAAGHARPDRLLPGAAVDDLPAGRDGRRRLDLRRAADGGRAARRRHGARGGRGGRLAAAARARRRRGGARRRRAGRAQLRHHADRQLVVAGRRRRRTPAPRSTWRTPPAPRSPCWARCCCWPGWSRALVWVPAAVGAVPLTLYTMHVIALSRLPGEGEPDQVRSGCGWPTCWRGADRGGGAAARAARAAGGGGVAAGRAVRRAIDPPARPGRPARPAPTDAGAPTVDPPPGHDADGPGPGRTRPPAIPQRAADPAGAGPAGQLPPAYSDPAGSVGVDGQRDRQHQPGHAMPIRSAVRGSRRATAGPSQEPTSTPAASGSTAHHCTGPNTREPDRRDRVGQPEQHVLQRVARPAATPAGRPAAAPASAPRPRHRSSRRRPTTANSPTHHGRARPVAGPRPRRPDPRLQQQHHARPRRPGTARSARTRPGGVSSSSAGPDGPAEPAAPRRAGAARPLTGQLRREPAAAPTSRTSAPPCW